MSEYKVKYVFTTVSKNSRITAKIGTIGLSSEMSPEELIKDPDLINSLTQYSEAQLKKKVIMLNIESIVKV